MVTSALLLVVGSYPPNPSPLGESEGTVMHHQVTIATHINNLIVSGMTWERLDRSSLPKHYSISP